MDFEKSTNSLKKKKNTLPNSSDNVFPNLLIVNFGIYITENKSFSHLDYGWYFIAKYWNFDQIKLLLGNVHAIHAWPTIVKFRDFHTFYIHSIFFDTYYTLLRYVMPIVLLIFRSMSFWMFLTGQNCINSQEYREFIFWTFKKFF